MGFDRTFWRGSIEPSGAFDRAFLGQSPNSGYHLKFLPTNQWDGDGSAQRKRGSRVGMPFSLGFAGTGNTNGQTHKQKLHNSSEPERTKCRDFSAIAIAIDDESEEGSFVRTIFLLSGTSALFQCSLLAHVCLSCLSCLVSLGLGGQVCPRGLIRKASIRVHSFIHFLAQEFPCPAHLQKTLRSCLAAESQPQQ